MQTRRLSNRSRRFATLAAQALAVGVPALAWGGVSFNSGSATWSWDADTNSSNGGKTTFVITPPTAGSLSGSPFQLSRNGTFTTASSAGRGSIGYITNPTTASFAFRSGSGVTQVDPSNLFTGVSVTKVQFSGLFDATGGGFGPTSTGYFSLTVGGTAGVNGYAQVVGDVVFRLNNSGGSNLRSPIALSGTFNGGATGTTFNQTYTYSLPFSPTTIPSGQKVFVSGSLTFVASNQDTPSDITPLQFEAGGAPPTATFFGDAGADWTNPLSWAPPAGAFVEPGAVIPAVPDGAGFRARFVDDGSTGPRSIGVPGTVTLGALHVDDDDRLTILSFEGGTLQFDHTAESATFFVGNETGEAGVTVNTFVALSDALNVHLRGNMGQAMTSSLANDVVFNEEITSGSLSTGSGLRVTGVGGVTLAATNSYAGATVVADGAKLDAAAPGSLSTGPVSAQRGLLILSHADAQAGGATGIDATDNGQVDLNVGSLSPQSTFRIGATGIISGSPSELQQLTIGQNLLIQPGGVIGHESFDTSGTNGNPGNLPLEPTYVFGISADFNSNSAGSITVGSEAAGAWAGFGSDRLIRRFGDDPTQADGPSVIVAGNATLSAGERLVLNGLLESAGSLSSAAVTGRGGTVEVANMANPFDGNMNVTEEATMRVNGQLPAVQGVQVNGGGTLGGHGGIGGTVDVQDDGMLDPGDERTLTDLRIGSLTVNNILFSQNSILRFQLGGEPEAGVGVASHDLLIVNGDLVLDGQLLIEQLQFFDSRDIYPIINFNGQLTNNGLEISPLSQEINGLPAVQVAGIQIVLNPGGGGTVFVVVPEPSSAGLLALAGAALARRRGLRK